MHMTHDIHHKQWRAHEFALLGVRRQKDLWTYGAARSENLRVGVGFWAPCQPDIVENL